MEEPTKMTGATADFDQFGVGPFPKEFWVKANDIVRRAEEQLKHDENCLRPTANQLLKMFYVL